MCGVYLTAYVFGVQIRITSCWLWPVFTQAVAMLDCVYTARFFLPKYYSYCSSSTQRYSCLLNFLKIRCVILLHLMLVWYARSVVGALSERDQGERVNPEIANLFEWRE
jgi:hypothetical protein